MNLNKKIDYANSFAAPHRITLARPTSGHKTLVDLDTEAISLKWSYDSLIHYYPTSWQAPKINWQAVLKLYIDGQKISFSNWHRIKGGIPSFIIEGEAVGINYCFEGIATEIGDVIKLKVRSLDSKTHNIVFTLESITGWIISNPAWVNGENSNVLLAMMGERADKLLAISVGADEYPINIGENTNNEIKVPMSNSINAEGNLAKTIMGVINLDRNSTKEAFIIRTYEKLEADIEQISKINFNELMKKAIAEYEDIYNRSTKFIVPDKEVVEAYKSCLFDLFVMRENLKFGYVGISCGTEVYRSINPAEPCIANMLFDQVGLKEEAEKGLWVHLDAQDESGCWASSKGWERSVWIASGCKAKMALEHYKLTGDLAFLEKIYPRMKKSTLWNYEMREKSKKDIKSPFYGLMPRGMGDCGLMNHSDYFGVFYPHNCHTIDGDICTLEAAKILNKKEDIKQLSEIIVDAKNNLIKSMRENAVCEDGYKRIPGTAGYTGGSTYGSLYAYTFGFLEADDELIIGTLKYFEKNISKYGQPLGTGWMKNGAWVAMTLDNLAMAHLAMGHGDKANDYFYSSLNHASPLVTWCEERGAEAGTKETSGDLQHLWTPVAVCRYLRDALVVERKDVLHLASGTSRDWLKSGNTIGVKGACTHFGEIDYSIERNLNKISINFKAYENRKLNKIYFHIRLPEENNTLILKNSQGCKTMVENNIIIATGAIQNLLIEAEIKINNR